jgi:hypothetical protein
MSEVVVTGIGPLLTNCADRRTLWTHLYEGPSQLAFVPAPGGDGEHWPVGRVHGFEPERWLARFPHRYYQRYHREQQLYLASLAIDHVAGGGRPSSASAGLAVSYGIGGHSAMTLVGAAEAA